MYPIHENQSVSLSAALLFPPTDFLRTLIVFFVEENRGWNQGNTLHKILFSSKITMNCFLLRYFIMFLNYLGEFKNILFFFFFFIFSPKTSKIQQDKTPHRYISLSLLNVFILFYLNPTGKRNNNIYIMNLKIFFFFLNKIDFVLCC